MKYKNPSPYGWIIVGVSFVTLALVYGVWYGFSVFFVALLKEFGWSRSVGAGDAAGSYVPAFVILILCAVLACSNIWWAAPRKIRRVPGKAKSAYD